MSSGLFDNGLHIETQKDPDAWSVCMPAPASGASPRRGAHLLRLRPRVLGKHPAAAYGAGILVLGSLHLFETASPEGSSLTLHGIRSPISS